MAWSEKLRIKEEMLPQFFSSSMSFLRITTVEVFLSFELLSQAHGQSQSENDMEM